MYRKVAHSPRRHKTEIANSGSLRRLETLGSRRESRWHRCVRFDKVVIRSCDHGERARGTRRCACAAIVDHAGLRRRCTTSAQSAGSISRNREEWLHLQESVRRQSRRLHVWRCDPASPPVACNTTSRMKLLAIRPGALSTSGGSSAARRGMHRFMLDRGRKCQSLANPRGLPVGNIHADPPAIGMLFASSSSTKSDPSDPTCS